MLVVDVPVVQTGVVPQVLVVDVPVVKWVHAPKIQMVLRLKT